MFLLPLKTNNDTRANMTKDRKPLLWNNEEKPQNGYLKTK